MNTETKTNSSHQTLPQVIILTAQPEVFNEVCTYLTDRREEVHPEDTIYDRGIYKQSSATWQVVVAEVGKGNNSAAMETERAINHFKPDIALFVGLAGGLKEVSVGDVVASTKIYGYESGKVTESFETIPNVGQSSYSLEQRAKAEARKGDWLNRLNGLEQNIPPRVRVGAIAAGEKYVKSDVASIISHLKANYGDAYAIEMEGRGFLEAIRANKRVEAIVIRGISNLVFNQDKTHSPDSSAKATRNACAFAFELLAKLQSAKASQENYSQANNQQNTAHKSNDSKIQPISNASASIKNTRGDNFKINTIENLFSVLTTQPSPIFLLGGGTAVKSGIPLSEGIVEKAVRWDYCNGRGLEFDDPSVRRSDWLQPLRRESWYNHESLSANYSNVMRNLLRPRENRRQFFLHLLRTKIPASRGYGRLVELLSLKLFTTILTTNFDTVLRDLCSSQSRLHHYDVVDNPGTFRQLTTSPSYPVLTYLYGTLEDYIDRFETSSEPKLDDALISRLTPILRDHPLIVVGYSGSEETIMRQFLIEQIQAADFYHQGVYWCALDYENQDDLHPLVREFAGLIRGNFQVIPISGFDELMEQLFVLNQKRGPVNVVKNTALSKEGPEVPSFDMQPIDAVDMTGEFDWTTLQTRLVNYCDAMDIAVPSVVSREWLIEQLCQLDLAVKAEKKQIKPTNAGYLLFARKTHERIANAKILLRFFGEEQLIEGNLWNQLAVATDALAEVNKPFRLKGEKSDTVYPYPPLALKEVLVNSLVHRNYRDEEYVIVEIESDSIRFTNPGGLVEQVLRQTEGTSILTQIEQGKRGIKGYRNPVLADLFYSSGDMDKEGSGLADVHQLVNDNGGRVSFEAINGNTAFEVVIYSRPEAVDKQTRTAPTVVTTRYAANMLEVLEMPDTVWQAPSPYKRAKDIWTATKADWLPPFVAHEQKLHSFLSFNDESNMLGDVVDIYAETSLTLEQFYADENDPHGNERRLVWLLNECLYRHLDFCGLYVDKKRKRAYFPRTDEGIRAVAYQARLRRSTRKVTKPIISPTTQQIRYWEHQSFSFSFERFADTWTLQILPGYVFTKDGYRNLLSGNRVNILSTKRASRDYNSKVHVDLVFWAWVLSQGAQGSFELRILPEKSKKRKNSAEMQKLNLKVNRDESENTFANLPRVLIKSTLPTVALYSLEPADNDEEDSLLDEERLAERRDIEEALGALAELPDDEFDDLEESD